MHHSVSLDVPGSCTLTCLCDRLALTFLFVLAAIAASTFRDYGLGWDDYTQSQYGDLLLAFYTSGFTDRRALSFVNLYMYGGGFDLVSAIAGKVLPFDLFETRRLIGAAVGLIGVAIAWRLARRLAGPAAGLAAIALLATTPMYYGHMFMNSKDGPFAVAMCVLLFALLRAVEEYPAPSRSTVAILGAAIGLAIGTRILAVIAVLYVVLPLALLIAEEARTYGLRTATRRFGSFVLVLLPGLLIAYLLMGLLWPWSVLEPLNPFRAIAYFSHFFEKPWKEMYEGVPIFVPDMPATYVPRLLGLKLPEATLMLGIAGLIAIVLAATHRALPVRRRAGLLLILCAAVVPVAYAIVSRPALYNGLRHFLFVIPPIAIVAAVALVWLLEWLRLQCPGLAIAGGVALVFGMSTSVTAMMRLHPYQYTYFNVFAGGVRGAKLNYMLDYWGLAFKQATEKLKAKLENEKPPSGREYWVVGVCGPQSVAKVELGSKFYITDMRNRADFVLALNEYYCRDISAPVFVRVVRDEVTFASVYDVRGGTGGGASVRASPP